MRQVTIICDKCGRVVTDEQPGVLTLSGMGVLAKTERVDLCADCSALLADWLRSGRIQAAGSVA
jgi:hypothetical protein